MNVPFSEILKAEVENNDIKLTDLEIKLRKFGITAKRLSEYKNGIHTPPFDKAKIILKVLHYDISDSELADSLKLNKEFCEINKSYGEERYRVISIRLNLKKIMPDKKPEYVESILIRRIRELYKDGSQIGNYVHDLISKDLNEFILEEKNDESN